MSVDKAAANPFVRYRELLDSYAEARSRGWSDLDFVKLVERLDEAVQGVEGFGSVRTPLVESPALASEVGWRRGLVKDDTRNVGGSHKARHLFGVLLASAVGASDRSAELVIASCGNAALAAAVVASAADRRLRVFIPTWADAAVVERLEALGAAVEVCERRPGELGDPTYRRLVEAVESGSTPFSVQGTVTPTTLDGGRTIGWETAEQLGDHGVAGELHVFVQVGGGALATSLAEGVADGRRRDWHDADPVIHPVQTEACAPLWRAWDRLLAAAGISGTVAARRAREAQAACPRLMEMVDADPEAYMFPWEDVGSSAASGILDDVTYDWRTVIEHTIRTGGWPIVVSEHDVAEAVRLGRRATGIPVSATGTAGLAGALVDPTGDAGLLAFTGHEVPGGRSAAGTGDAGDPSPDGMS